MDKASLLRRGVWVLVGLAVFTVIEFVVAVGGFGSALLALLALVALAKAVLIADYFMHLGAVFQPESGGH